jgi:hypothetical protein
MPASIIALILQYGLQYGPTIIADLVSLFTKVGGPTAEDWAALIAKTSTTARQQMLSTLAAHNIDPNSDQGKAFLSLVPS